MISNFSFSYILLTRYNNQFRNYGSWIFWWNLLLVLISSKQFQYTFLSLDCSLTFPKKCFDYFKTTNFVEKLKMTISIYFQKYIYLLWTIFKRLFGPPLSYWKQQFANPMINMLSLLTEKYKIHRMGSTRYQLNRKISNIDHRIKI